VLLESRALTVTGGPDPVARQRVAGVPSRLRSALGLDGVSADRRGRRDHERRRAPPDGALASRTAANVIRAIDATTTKPETGSTIAVTAAALKQIATIQRNPERVSGELGGQLDHRVDLRLAVNAGLDKLVLDVIAGAGFQAPGTDPLVDSIRKAITVIEAAGYSPTR
jgi:hypothetical protein